MSLEINNVSLPQNVPMRGVAASQNQLHVGGYSLISKLPERTPSVTDTTIGATEAMREFTAAAQVAAAGVRETDPMKPIADGIANDLNRANGDVFDAMGRINEIQNAFNFTLQANANLMEDPALQAIS